MEKIPSFEKETKDIFLKYKEDCESLLYINKTSNNYDQDIWKLDLTWFIFWMWKKIFKNDFLNCVWSSSFKELIKDIYWLKWDFEIFFSEKWSRYFILIKKWDRNNFWIERDKIELLIKNDLNLNNENEIHIFLRKIIYWIDWYLIKNEWLWFKSFIIDKIQIEVQKVLENNRSINNNKFFIKKISQEMLNANYDYIHSTYWHRIMSQTKELVLNELLGNKNQDLVKSINLIFNQIVTILNKKNLNESDKEEINKNLENNILLDFQKKIWVYFKNFLNKEIDQWLLEWMILFLIRNNNLNLNTNKLLKSIFTLIKNDIDCANQLFEKYNWKICEKNWKKYKYSKFYIKSLPLKSSEYNSEIILSQIKEKIEIIDDISSKIKKKQCELNDNKFNNYNYSLNTDNILKTLNETRLEIESISLKKELIEDEIKNINTKWFLNKIRWRDKINKLQEKYNLLYDNILRLTHQEKNIENKIIRNEIRAKSLNNSKNLINREIDDLTIIYINKKNELDEIWEDFIKTILFWKKEIN